MAFYLARGQDPDKLANKSYLEKIFYMAAENKYWKDLAKFLAVVLFGCEEEEIK